MAEMWRPLGLRVKGFYADKKGTQLSDTDVAVCTIERANALVNSLLTPGPPRKGKKPDTMACLAGVVVDEIHMLGDRSR